MCQIHNVVWGDAISTNEFHILWIIYFPQVVKMLLLTAMSLFYLTHGHALPKNASRNIARPPVLRMDYFMVKLSHSKVTDKFLIA